MNEKINKLLENINGYPLDNSQRKVVTSSKKHLLVSAGAGSGKSLTIIGKIRYLIEIKGFKTSEILCISFTNDATNSLKDKLINNYGYNITCYTFHKLGLEILKDEHKKICPSDLLSYVITEYLNALIQEENKKRVLTVLGIKHNSFNFEKKYSSINKKNLEDLAKLILKFINLFKAGDYPPEAFKTFINTSKSKKDKEFLILTYYIYYTYQKELESKNEIDFSDMISKATKKVKEEGYSKKLKFIIIDEFQDSATCSSTSLKR